MTGADFQDLVEGRRAAHIVRQDAGHVAFLAERPVRPGHLVVCTRDVVDSVFDLTPAASAMLWAFVHQLARDLRQRLPCERVCVSVIGWLVRHAHVHLVPTDAPGQVSLVDGPALPPATMAAIATRLSSPPADASR